MRGLLLLVLMMPLVCFGQTIERSEKYLKDFDFFIDKLEETHPDPYTRFGGRVEFYRDMKKTKERVKEAKTDDEFVELLNSFLSPLKDGHTYINSINKGDKSNKVLPVKFRIASDGLFIYNTTKDLKRYIGLKLVSVNGVSVSGLLEKVNKLQPSENIYGQYRGLIYRLSSKALCKGVVDNVDEINFTLTDGLEQFDLIVSFCDCYEFMHRKSKVKINKDNNILYTNIIGKRNKTGYLCWNTMLSRELLERSKRDRPNDLNWQLRWAFSSLQKKQTGDIDKDIIKIPLLYKSLHDLLKSMESEGAKHLIIDLRNNGGGMTPLTKSVLYMLYGDRYLNFDFDADYIVKFSPMLIKKWGFDNIDEYNKRNNTDSKYGDYMFNSFGTLNQDKPIEIRRAMIDKGYYGFGAEYVKGVNRAFVDDLKIIVITSPATFSAAYHFTYFLHKLGRTTIVGVGSRQAGNAFMEVTQITLPETKINGSISNAMQVLFKNDKAMGEILRPDYEMVVEDYIRYNADPNAEILEVLNLIKDNKL